MTWLTWITLFCCFAIECLAKDRLLQHTLEEQNSIQTEYNDDVLMDDLLPLPTFTADVKNKTVTAGRSAHLTCKVENLGNFKVAWVRVDTQTILTIHHNIITRNQRISLSHHDHKVWRLHINNVEESDRGWYMCQVNTDPMRSERGFLEVVVPPAIIDSLTSRDIIVKEGSPVNLTCEARGSPPPKIMWKREDGEAIRYKGGLVPSVGGNSLLIPAASRVHIGAYFCIASNGVPPSISKRIELSVQFAPMIWVQNQLEYAVVGRNTSLHCNTESYPPAIHFWKLQNGSAVSTGKKYSVHLEVKKYVTHVTLLIMNVDKGDFGIYKCVAKNSLGESDGTIKLSERVVSNPTYYTRPPSAPTEETVGEDHLVRGRGRQERLHKQGKKKKQGNTNLVTYKPFLPTESQLDTEREWNTADDKYPLFGNAGSHKDPCCLLIIVAFVVIADLKRLSKNCYYCC